MIKNKKLFLLLILISQSLFPAKAQSLIPDLSFGSNGVIHNDSTYAYCAISDSLGNYYISGMTAYVSLADYAIAKVFPNGQADPTFGVNGIATFDLGFPQQHINDLAVQPDGKIVFVGGLMAPSNWNGVIGRVTADGQLDTTFNGTGYLIIDVNSQYDACMSVVIQPNGKLVVGGTSCFGGTFDYKFAAWRFNSDGSPDVTFSNNGLFRYVTNGSAAKVLLDGNKIVLGGLLESPDYDYCIMRLDEWGTPDPTFASSGIFLYQKPGNNLIEDMILDGGNYIAVTTNYVGNPQTVDMKPEIFGVSNYGGLLTTWSVGGFYTFHQPGYSVMPRAIIKSGNTLIVGGIGFNTGSYGNQNGYNGVFFQVDLFTETLNTANGVNGLVSYGIPGVNEQIHYVNEEPNGKIVVIGGEGVAGIFISKYIYGWAGYEELESQNLKIYPNPASEFVTVYIDDENCETLEIRDLLGRLYQCTSVRQGKNEVMLEDLYPGSYILNVLDNSRINRISGKLIVE